MTDDHSADEPGRQSRTSRSEETARRRATAWRRAAAALGVLALLVVAGLLLLGGGVPGLENGDGDEGPSEFSFDLKSVKASPIGDTPPADLRELAGQAGADVKATMDELYFRAFVDSGSWGDYREAYALFEGQAVARAEAGKEGLTLGAAADQVYEAVEPTLGTIRIVVLTDANDAPVRAVAKIEFRADATLRDGSATVVSSRGAFYLLPVNGEWRIFAFDVDRDEEPAETPSPTEEAP